MNPILQVSDPSRTPTRPTRQQWVQDNKQEGQENINKTGLGTNHVKTRQDPVPTSSFQEAARNDPRTTLGD